MLIEVPRHQTFVQFEFSTVAAVVAAVAAAVVAVAVAAVAAVAVAVAASAAAAAAVTAAVITTAAYLHETLIAKKCLCYCAMQSTTSLD